LTPSYRLPVEVQSGLYEILLGLADLNAEGLPYTVLTTTPSTILHYCSQNATIYDLGPLFGSNDWLGDSEMRYSLVAQLLAAGWASQNIDLGNRLLFGHKAMIADVVLLDDNGMPLVMVEVARKDFNRYFRPEDMSRLQVLSREVGVYFYDGSTLFGLKEEQSKAMSLAQTALPRPEDFGMISAIPSVREELAQGITVTRITTVEEFMIAMEGDSTPRPFILDHTIPWGSRGSALVGLHERLPDELRSSRATGWDAPALLLALLAENCRIASRVIAVVPPTLAQSHHAETVRRFIGSRLPLAGAIDLPQGVFEPAFGIAAHLLLFGRFADGATEQTVFLALDSRGAVIAPRQQTWWEPLLRGLRGIGQPAPPVFTVAIGDNAYYSARAHDPAIRAVEDGLKLLAEVIPLGDLFDLSMGYPHSREEVRGNTQGMPMIRGRDFAAATLKQEDLTRFVLREDAPDRCVVRTGDVLIQRIGDRPRCLYVTADLEGAVADATVLILRPKDSRADGRYLCQFLRSQTGQLLLSRATAKVTIPTLSLRNLRELAVPDLGDIAGELELLQEIEGDLRARADYLSTTRLGLFSAENRDVFTNRLREMQAVGQATALSLRQVAAPDFQIRNFYPFPLAFPYRTLAGITIASELYKEQLRVAENVLAFLGSVTLAVLNPVDYPATELQPRELWGGGISPGHWRMVCQKGAAILKSYQGNNLALALAALWESKHKPKKDFRDSVEALIRAKNDFKHDRGPKTEEDMPPAVDAVQKHLDAILKELSFFTQHPIRLVRDMDLVRNSRTVVVQTLQYTGDHPGLQQERLEYPEPLKKNDLYIDCGVGTWTPLYPFVSACYCRSCGIREVYFIDYWDTRKTETKLKSFERGHLADPSSEIAVYLSEWAARNGKEEVS
jgi:hypothetical protein